MRSAYKRLGDYIKEVNTRNLDLATTNLLGVNIDKFFMPSVANVIGTDMSVYKIVKKGQFACNRMHVGRDYRLPIALSCDEEDFLVSPAYDVFEIRDNEELLPEYLMMWFSRKEFDRNAWFYTDADVRGGLHWKAFCDMELPVPNIETQREVVREYHTIVNRIKLNEQLNQKLEQTAQALYKQWFVDFEFPNENGKPYKSNGGEMVWCEALKQEIPKGWETCSIKDFCKEMKSGGTPNREVEEYWNCKDIPWLKTGELSNKVLVEAEEYISNKGCQNSSAKKLPINTVLIAMYGEGSTKGQVGFLKFEAATNQACCAMICDNENMSTYLYYFLRINRDEIANMANGGAQPNLSKAIIENLQIIKPVHNLFEKHPFVRIINYRESLSLECVHLQKLKFLLNSKMSKPELLETEQPA